MEVKDLILEILSLLPTDIRTSSFRALCEDKHLQVEKKIDEGEASDTLRTS